MKFNSIDIDNWDRKPYFEHFMKSARCTYSIVSDVEITALLHEIRLRKVKLYPALIYIITTVVNRHREFRTCFDESGNLGYWDEMNPGYTVFHRENETFSSIWTEYDEDFSRFHASYTEDIEEYGNVPEFTPKGEPAGTFPVSAVPWVSFTGFNLNVYDNGRYLLPIFTVGKYYERDGKTFIPMAVQVHHAVCDGYHAGRFIGEVQNLAVDCRSWLKVV